MPWAVIRYTRVGSEKVYKTSCPVWLIDTTCALIELFGGIIIDVTDSSTLN